MKTENWRLHRTQIMSKKVTSKKACFLNYERKIVYSEILKIKFKSESKQGECQRVCLEWRLNWTEFTHF